MSKQARDAAWEKSRQDGTTLVVLLALAEFANEEGFSWPAIPTLAARCRVNERQTSFHLNRLIAAGEIEITQNYGRGRSTTYRIRLMDTDWSPSAISQSDLKKVQKSAGFYSSKKSQDCVEESQKPAGFNGEKSHDSATLSGEESQKSAPFYEGKVAEKRIKKSQKSVKGEVPPPPGPRSPFRGSGAYAPLPGTVKKEPVSPIGEGQAAPDPVESADDADDPAKAPSALAYFLAVSKKQLGRTAQVPNLQAAGAMAKKLELQVGQPGYRAAVDLFFGDDWYRSHYGASWPKFWNNFETILAKATVTPPAPKPPQRRLSPVEQRRAEGEAEVNELFDSLIDQVTQAEQQSNYSSYEHGYGKDGNANGYGFEGNGQTGGQAGNAGHAGHRGRSGQRAAIPSGNPAGSAGSVPRYLSGTQPPPDSGGGSKAG